MDRALVVVEADERTIELIEEAGELASGVNAELILLRVTSESDYERDRREMEDVIGLEASGYDVEQAEEGARQFAEDVGNEALDGVDISFVAVGEVGSKADRVLAVAAERNCDHVFISGRKRSPSGKAVFGDAAQRVILNYDGPVTVTTR